MRKAEVYIHRLLKRGYKVALCQQLERPGKDKRLLKRAVVRVLTPGTILEEEALEAGQDMYLAALWPEGKRLGVAWAEAASGEFSAAEIPAEELANLVARLSVREWLLPEGWEPPCELPGARTLRPRGDFSAPAVESRFPGALPGDSPAARAAGAILAYLEETVGKLPHLRPPRLTGEQETMVLDPFTQRSLELLTPLRPEGKLTVLSVLDRTKTSMGRRLLRRWLLSPLRDRARIEARLDAVEALIEGPLWEPLGELLRRACDLPRLLGRVGTRTLRPQDLLALRRTLEVLPEIETLLAKLPSLLSLIHI